jgi:TonB family protein
MIPTYKLKALFTGWWKCSLLFFALNTLVAQDQLSFHFLRPDAENSYFVEDSEHSRIITTTNVLELTGQCSDNSVILVLFSINGKEYPKYLADGKFTTRVELEKGSNLIEAALPMGLAGSVKYEVILLEPGKISQIRLKPEGGEDKLREPVQDEAGVFGVLAVNIPQVRIAGSMVSHAGFEIRVKDPSGSPVIVEIDGDQFYVDYTLREGQNVLTFQSTFENKVFAQEELVFQLSDVISISPDEAKNIAGFVEQGDVENRINCLSSEFYLKGRVEAVANGSVILAVDDKTRPIEVKNHEFETVIPLEQNKLATVKVRIEVDDQVYADFLEVNQTQPELEIISLKEGLLDGTIIEDGDILRSDENAQYFSENPILNVTARISNIGSLSGSILNQNTDKEYAIEAEDGEFKTTVFLVEGENTLDFQVGNSNQTLSLDTYHIKLVSPVIFETVNDTPVESDIVYLSGNRCNLYGIVNSISRGFLTLKIDDLERNVPVIGGSFETETPLVLSPGEHVIEASIKIGQTIFSNSLTVVSEEVPEENTVVQNVITDDQGNTLTVEDDRRILPFNPPVPRRMPTPGRVFNRVNNTEETGSVTVQFVIGKKGRVDFDTVKIIESTNAKLDREARRSVARWRFYPATDADGPIDKTTRVTLTWK